MRKTLFTLTITILINGLHAQDSIYDILNFTNCPGIEVSGEPELYVGDDLFSLINGGAELYHEYGFVEVLAAELKHPSIPSLKIEVYDMGSTEGAWGIFSMTITSNSRTYPLGDAGRGGMEFLQFIKGKYMVYVYYHDTEENFRAVEYVAECVANNIEIKSEPPKVMNTVVTNRDSLEKLYYFRGNLGLSSVYNFHYKDVFGFKEGAAAVYPDMKVFLLAYEDEGQCIEHFNESKEFFTSSSKYHEQVTQRGSFHMKDRKRQEIDCYYENQFLIIFISRGEMDLNSIREDIVENIHE